MRVQPLGSTGLHLSELTFGTSPFETGRASAEDFSQALNAALDLGINAVEVGGPRAQDALGGWVQRGGRSSQLHLITRIPSLVPFDLPSPHIPAQQAYPGAHIRVTIETLLQRMGVERIAAVLIPDWCDEWTDEGDWGETLNGLRRDGKVGAFGVSLFDHDVDAGERIVASGAVQCIAVMYNLFDPGASERLFPLCMKHGVGVIARSPLYFGALSPRLGQAAPFDPADWRTSYLYPEHLAETRRRAASIEAEGGVLPETALRFALSHPAISSVAVGMRTLEQVQANAAFAASGLLPVEQLDRLRQHKWLC